jgi:hypothetical protein
MIKELNNKNIRFEILICLKNLIDCNLAYNFEDLLNNLVPYILELMNHYKKSNILWHLVSFLTKLLEKA